MYFIIGLYKEDKRILALKVYDTVTHETGLYHKNQVLDACKKLNIQVAGIVDKVYGSKTIKVLSHTLYNTSLLDIVDSMGNPIDNNHVQIPICTDGFKESMKVTLVDSNGKLEVVSYTELLDLLKKQKVTGVKKNKYLVFNKWCAQQGILSSQASE